MTADPPPDPQAPPPVIDLEREPGPTRRYRLGRRPRDPYSGLPWWARVGLRLPVRAEVAATIAAVAAALVGLAFELAFHPRM